MADSQILLSGGRTGGGGGGGAATPVADILTNANDPEVGLRFTRDDMLPTWSIATYTRNLGAMASGELSTTAGTYSVSVADNGADGNDEAIGLRSRGTTVARVDSAQAICQLPTAGAAGSGLQLNMPTTFAVGADGNSWIVQVRNAAGATNESRASVIIPSQGVSGAGIRIEISSTATVSFRGASGNGWSFAAVAAVSGETPNVSIDFTNRQVLITYNGAGNASGVATLVSSNLNFTANLVGAPTLPLGTDIYTMSGGADAAPAEDPSVIVASPTGIVTYTQDSSETSLVPVVQLFHDAGFSGVTFGSASGHPFTTGNYAFTGGVDAVAPVYGRPLGMTLSNAEVLLWCEGAEEEHGLRLIMEPDPLGGFSQVTSENAHPGAAGARGNNWEAYVVHVHGTSTVSVVWGGDQVRLNMPNTNLTALQINELANYFFLQEIGSPVGRRLNAVSAANATQFSRGSDGVTRHLWLQPGTDTNAAINTAMHSDTRFTSTFDSTDIGTQTLAQVLMDAYVPTTYAIAETSVFIFTATTEGATTWHMRSVTHRSAAGHGATTFDFSDNDVFEFTYDSTRTTGQILADVQAEISGATGWIGQLTVSLRGTDDGTNTIPAGQISLTNFSGGVDSSGEVGDPAVRFSGGRDAEPIEIEEVLDVTPEGELTTTLDIKWNNTVDTLNDIDTVLETEGFSTWYRGGAQLSSVPEDPFGLKSVGPVTRAGGSGGGGLTTAQVNALIQTAVGNLSPGFRLGTKLLDDHTFTYDDYDVVEVPLTVTAGEVYFMGIREATTQYLYNYVIADVLLNEIDARNAEARTSGLNDTQLRRYMVPLNFVYATGQDYRIIFIGRTTANKLTIHALNAQVDPTVISVWKLV